MCSKSVKGSGFFHIPSKANVDNVIYLIFCVLQKFFLKLHFNIVNNTYVTKILLSLMPIWMKGPRPHQRCFFVLRGFIQTQNAKTYTCTSIFIDLLLVSVGRILVLA